jgi:Ca2+-transporting ATPase
MIMQKNGLSSEEVKNLQLKHGKNILPLEKSVSAVKIFFSQFTNPLVYLLLFTGIISLFLKKYLDIVFIFSVVFLNAIFGFIQEYKAHKTLIALKKLVKPIAKVIRDGKRQEIEASELVKGDIVFLVSGDKVPADGKIIEMVSFFVNEAILTGESEPVEKKPEDEVFMGTIISSGRAVIKINKTGLETKIGEIAKTLKETEQPLTTLQLRFKKFTHTLIYFSIFLALLVFILGFLTGKGITQMIQMSVIMLVAIIPEALIIAITLVLVIAMQKTLKRKALIRKLLAVETLGSVTTICTDKTGTLTEGKMVVSETDFYDLEKSFLSMCLCNNLSDAVEITLWDYLGQQKNFSPKEIFDKYTRIFEIPFSSEHKFMATVNRYPADDNDNYFLFIKGAPETILKMSNLQEKEQKLVLEKIENWAKKGLKVLGLAFQKISLTDAKKLNIKNIPQLQWGGAVGFWDPPRKEAKEALSIARQAGIKVKVVTGDYRYTAEKIMEFLGIKVGPKEILEGPELEKLTDAELKEKISNILLFSRVTPHQKLKIVKVLQEEGEIVAMTGDGVNDAPALKKSNIGIVVGEASEVAKETADLILLDSNFKTIISAIEVGRVVFENIKKVVFYMLSNSFAEIVVITGSIILGWDLPLTIIQILWLHLLCDGPEDIVLGFEPEEKEVMIEGPKSINEALLDKTYLFLIFLISFLSGFFALLLFWYFAILNKNIDLGRTMSFLSLSLSSIFFIFPCRSFRKPFWRYENFWSNKWLFGAIIFSLVLQVFVINFPPTQKILGIVPLKSIHWILLLLVAVIIILIIELAKSQIIKRKST